VEEGSVPAKGSIPQPIPVVSLDHPKTLAEVEMFSYVHRITALKNCGLFFFFSDLFREILVEEGT
jgi:hypothetical protein